MLIGTTTSPDFVAQRMSWWLVMVGRLLAVTLVVAGCGIEIGSSGLACQDPPTQAEILGQREVPNLLGLKPAAAAERLEEAGIAPSWRYSYRTNPPGRTDGYSECWCVPPPDGEVNDVIAEPDEQLIVFVERSQPIAGGRAQPTQGWGCEDHDARAPIRPQVANPGADHGYHLRATPTLARG